MFSTFSLGNAWSTGEYYSTYFLQLKLFIGIQEDLNCKSPLFVYFYILMRTLYQRVKRLAIIQDQL